MSGTTSKRKSVAKVTSKTSLRSRRASSRKSTASIPQSVKASYDGVLGYSELKRRDEKLTHRVTELEKQLADQSSAHESELLSVREERAELQRKVSELEKQVRAGTEAAEAADARVEKTRSECKKAVRAVEAQATRDMAELRSAHKEELAAQFARFEAAQERVAALERRLEMCKVNPVSLEPFGENVGNVSDDVWKSEAQFKDTLAAFSKKIQKRKRFLQERVQEERSVRRRVSVDPSSPAAK